MRILLPAGRSSVSALTVVLSRRRGITVLLLVGVLALAAACGSDGDKGASTTTESTATVSAAEAEAALRTELSEGGGGGIVHHEGDTPKLVTCKKEAASKSGWECTVTPSKSSESYLCMVEVNPPTKRTTKTTCARIDN
jgi:hypothetical protein